MGTTTTLVTVQEFLALPEPEGERKELIGGEIVCMGQGGRAHEFVKSNINKLLLAWLLQKRSGRVLVETGFQIDGQSFLIPDLSYVSKDPGEPGDQRQIQGAPDLPIEAVSSETAARLEGKIELYFAHGSKSVWVVYPEQQVVRIFDSSGNSRMLEQSQTLEDPALPGFTAPVSAIFEGI